MKKRSAWFAAWFAYHWRCGDDGGGTDGKGSGAETVYSWV